MSLPLVIIAFGVIMYLSNAIYMQKKKNEERTQKINNAKNLYIYSQTETQISKQDLLNSITKYYGKYDSDRVSQAKIWINMDSNLLVASWGKPCEIKESYIRNNRVERWYYDPYYNRLDNLKYKFEISIENNHIIGWKDLT